MNGLTFTILTAILVIFLIGVCVYLGGQGGGTVENDTLSVMMRY